MLRDTDLAWVARMAITLNLRQWASLRAPATIEQSIGADRRGKLSRASLESHIKQTHGIVADGEDKCI